MTYKDHGTVINTTVYLAARIMQDKAEEIALIASIFADKHTPEGDEQAARLRAEVAQILDAVKVMDDRGGSWR